VPIEDTHEFITELEKNGELKRVKTEVDSNLEIAEILRREMYSKGSAILFENGKNDRSIAFPIYASSRIGFPTTVVT